MCLDFIGKTVLVKIERSLGTCHPQHGFIYPLNYGYVPGTISPDGEALDAYVLGVFEPLVEFTGRCIAVIHRLDEDDDKLVLAPEGKSYSDEQILALVEFQERFFTPEVQRGRGALIAKGRTAEVYAWPGNRVLKLFFTWCKPEWVRYEAEIGRLVAKTNLPSPKLVDTIEFEGRQGILYERMDGATVLRILLNEPWRMPRLARQFGELHSAIHLQSGEGLPTVRYWLGDIIRRTSALPDDLKKGALQLLDRLPDGKALCHMDYHPDQVLVTPRGLAVIDWMNGHQGHHLADVARTCLMLRYGQPPDASGPMVLLASLAKGVFYQGYLRRYQELNPGLSMAELNDWMVVVAAARLNEQLPGEQGPLLDLIRAGLMKADRTSLSK